MGRTINLSDDETLGGIAVVVGLLGGEKEQGSVTAGVVHVESCPHRALLIPARPAVPPHGLLPRLVWLRGWPVVEEAGWRGPRVVR